MAENTVAREIWLRCFHPKPAATRRLICFPHAGGSATYFHPVSAAVPATMDVIAIQYPGRQDRRREPPVEDLGLLADLLADVLEQEFDLPVSFFGHSMGATVAYETARRLEQRGTHITALFASGRRAPSAVRDERTHLLGDEEFLAEIKSLDGTDTQVFGDDEIVRMVLPAIRNDYRAAETYRHVLGTELSCPIFALIGRDDPKVTAAEADAWQRHTTGKFSLHEFTGGHFYLNGHAGALIDLMVQNSPGPVTNR